MQVNQKNYFSEKLELFQEKLRYMKSINNIINNNFELTLLTCLKFLKTLPCYIFDKLEKIKQDHVTGLACNIFLVILLVFNDRHVNVYFDTKIFEIA